MFKACSMACYMHQLCNYTSAISAAPAVDLGTKQSVSRRSLSALSASASATLLGMAEPL